VLLPTNHHSQQLASTLRDLIVSAGSLHTRWLQLLEGYEVSEEGNFEVPLPQPATYQDWLQEMRDASQGARPGLELTGAQASALVLAACLLE
jgi:hypothetical protein